MLTDQAEADQPIPTPCRVPDALGAEGRRRRDSGQMLIVFALTWAVFIGGLAIVFNTGYLVGERVRIQQIADNAAYSGAVWEARSLNFVAYANRAIVADLAFLAYLTAMQSHLEAWAMLIDYLATLANFIPYVGSIISQVLSTVSDIIEQLADAVGDVKDSSLWEAVMDSLYYSQTAMLAYTALTLNGIMQEVAHDADPNVSINGLFSPTTAVNLDNFTSMYRDSQGEGKDLQDLTRATISSWTKGTDHGIVPFMNREWMLIPRSVENSILRWVSVSTGLPSNFGIWGDINVNSSGFRSKDYVYVASWRIRRWRLRRRTTPISPIYSAERDIDWDDIGFYKYDPDGPVSAGVWAIASKPAGTLNNFIYRAVVAAPLAGGKQTLVVPQRGLGAVSKAVARYVDPQQGSARHALLVTQNREPNIFNPFWKAELVAVNHDQSGITPDEDNTPFGMDLILRATFDTYSLLDFWTGKVRH